jgi:anti-anti-sigma factor
MPAPRWGADYLDVFPAASHSFRYELELCTLADGQTLSDWRRGAGPASDAGHVSPGGLGLHPVSGVEPPPFSISVERHDGHVVVTARGELDLATASELEGALAPVVSGGGHAVLDLRELEFMDSSGVRVIVGAHLSAKEHGGRLSLVRLQSGSPVHRVLEISGLDGVLDVVDDT